MAKKFPVRGDGPRPEYAAAKQDDLHDHFWSKPTADKHGDSDTNKEQVERRGLGVVVLHRQLSQVLTASGLSPLTDHQKTPLPLQTVSECSTHQDAAAIAPGRMKT